MKRRWGLTPPLNRRQFDALARAETVAVALLRGVRKFRRAYDPPGVYRIADPSKADVSDVSGLTVAIIGFTDGVEDPGLNCSACPLCDLEPLETP